ncbi:MAG TPA: peptidyl-prolyl cis-trans isomerase [Candidatus Sulfotelmatobacter sp.]|jgi:peptidyl-prolyl cis-trans isomerase D|nr:peptidyl-prolyl cis-trans isomerase [Candidatus Sulfotelmatobacter sp.]
MIRFLQTPGPIKKYVLGAILVVITISMVWYLVPQGNNSSYNFGGTKQGVVAQVAGNEITADDVRETARQMAAQQAQRYGEMANRIMPFLISQAIPQAADQLISRQALIDEAGRMGLRVTPDEVRDDLQHGRYAATFFPGGNFIGQQEYEDTLARANLTPAKFEDAVGKDIVLSKLQALVTGSASVSESEIHDEFVKQNTKVKFDYAVLKQDDIKKGLHPTDAELKAFYESHKQSYANSIPEKRKVKYAVIDTNKEEATVQVTQDDLRRYYDQNRDSYRVPEQIKVSHIWIKMPLTGDDGKVDDKKVTEAQHRAEDLLKQIKGGAKFEDVAKKYSEDSGSANVGGSLGWIGKGQMTPEFEKAANALAKGQISDVVKSTDGFHIIRLDDKQDAHVKPLDEVKDQIEPALKHQKAQQLAQKEAEDLLAQSKTKGLDAAASAMGIPLITSDFFSRKDMLPGLGPAPQFIDAVFNAQEKSPPDAAPATQGIAVFQLVAIKPASTPSFEEIRSRVESEFQNERSSVLLSQKVQELSDRAKAEHDLKKAAKELGATVKTSDLVLPDGQVPDVGSMSGQASVAFTMKPGEISGPINEGATASVLQLLESRPPSEADYAAKRDQIRDSLLQVKQQERFSLFVSNLIDQMTKAGKIRKNEDELKTLSKSGTETGM